MVSSSLPSKENSVFKNILKYYETKQYKKALKSADSILKKFPNHGETLALKGLVVAALNRKQEAYDLVRQGLKNDLKSHICWHVYGLLYRGDQDYKEAAKAYLQALKFDPENIQILRDLALLQIQTRDYDGLLVTRRKLVTIKPGIKNHWLGFAVACHLKGEMDIALKVLESFESTLGRSSDAPNSAASEKKKEKGASQEAKVAELEEKYETSETLLYHAMILQEMGSWQTALTYLEENKGRIVDSLSYLEFRANLLVQLLCSQSISSEELERLYTGEPETCILQLLDMNPDNVEYIQLYETVYRIRKNIHSSNCLEALNELEQRYPYSSSLKRLVLQVATEDEFFRRFKSYVCPFLYRGVPSLMTDCKSLYLDNSKVNIIERVLSEFYEKSLNKETTMDQNSTEDGDIPPDATLWCLYFMAQHFDMKGDTEQALSCIRRAIDHTPTLVEAYSLQSKIFKHAGGMLQSLASANEARKLDLADRYLNCQCIKLALRLDMISLAETWMSLFTKEEGVKESQNIYDLQVIWYELECAESHFRLGELPQALKKWKAVERHFQDIYEDQFDFHSYCLRKTTLRAYVRVLRLEDKLLGQKYYIRTAKGLVKLFLKMSELQQRKSEENVTLENLSLSPKNNNNSDKNNKSHKDVNNNRTNSQSSGVGGSGWMEVDPNGESLYESIQDPLGEASKYIHTLERYAGEDIQVQILALDVAMKREKLVLSLKAIVRMSRLVVHKEEDNSEDFYLFLVKKLQFAHFLGQHSHHMEQLPLSITSYVKEECHRICEGGKTFESLLMHYWDLYRDTLAFLVYLAELLEQLDILSKYSFVLESLVNRKQMTSNNIIPQRKICERHVLLLERLGISSVEELRSFYRNWYPYSDCFQSPQEIQSTKHMLLEELKK